jgi:hypothetical protein
MAVEEKKGTRGHPLMKHAIPRATLATAVLACLGVQAYAGYCPTRDRNGEACVVAIKNETQPMYDGGNNYVVTYHKNPSCPGTFRVMGETNEGKELGNGFGGDETTLNCTTNSGCSGLKEKFTFVCTDSSPDSGSNTPAAVPAVPTQTPKQTPTPTPAPSATVPPSQTILTPPQPSAPRSFSLEACLTSNAACHSSCLQTFGAHGSKQADSMLACNGSCTSQENACAATGNALVNTGAALAAGASTPSPDHKNSESETTHLRTPGSVGESAAKSNRHSGASQSAKDKCWREASILNEACSAKYGRFVGGWWACVKPNNRCNHM